jgi:hypothetical protein
MIEKRTEMRTDIAVDGAGGDHGRVRVEIH